MKTPDEIAELESSQKTKVTYYIEARIIDRIKELTSKKSNPSQFVNYVLKEYLDALDKQEPGKK